MRRLVVIREERHGRNSSRGGTRTSGHPEVSSSTSSASATWSIAVARRAAAESDADRDDQLGVRRGVAITKHAVEAANFESADRIAHFHSESNWSLRAFRGIRPG